MVKVPSINIMKYGSSGRAFLLSCLNIVVIVATSGKNPTIGCDQAVLVVLTGAHRARTTVAWHEVPRLEGEVG